MTQLFGHEKLNVYQKAMQFVAFRDTLLGGLVRRVAACDHLNRGAESILLNIAHASSTWYPRERMVYLGHANGSSLECAGCLDVLAAKALLDTKAIYPGKSILSEIVSILITMRKRTADRTREDRALFSTREGRLFSHEDLNVYQAALQFIAWLEKVGGEFSCSIDLISKLDKSTTAIILNIAEGNGRFTGADQARFLGIAYKATVQSASLLDVATYNTAFTQANEGIERLRRIAAMLMSLSRTAADNS